MDAQDPQRIEASRRLLDEHHEFPCEFMVKVIGLADDEFVQRVVMVIRQCQESETDPPFQVRETPSGRHVAVTLQPHLASANEALAIYRKIREVEGVVMVM